MRKSSVFSAVLESRGDHPPAASSRGVRRVAFAASTSAATRSAALSTGAGSAPRFLSSASQPSEKKICDDLMAKRFIFLCRSDSKSADGLGRFVVDLTSTRKQIAF